MSGQSRVLSERLEQKPAGDRRACCDTHPGRKSGCKPQVFSDDLRRHDARNEARCVPLAQSTGTAGCGTARPVVWEGGGGDPAPYPMAPVTLPGARVPADEAGSLRKLGRGGSAEVRCRSSLWPGAGLEGDNV
jgi:hypothetical protein